MAKKFQVLRTRGLLPRLLYLARLSIKIEGQKKSFPNKNSKRIYLHQTSSARDVKWTALRKGRKRETEGEREGERAGGEREETGKKKKGMNKYLLIITLTKNG